MQCNLWKEELAVSRTCPAFVLKYSVNGGVNVALVNEFPMFNKPVFLIACLFSRGLDISLDEQEFYRSSRSKYVPTRNGQPNISGLYRKLFVERERKWSKDKDVKRYNIPFEIVSIFVQASGNIEKDLGTFFKNVTSILCHIIRHANVFLNPKYQWHCLNKSYLIHFYSISHNLKNLRLLDLCIFEIFDLYSSNIRDSITCIWSVEYRVCWKCASVNPSSQPLSPLPWTAVSGCRITFLRNIVDSLREIFASS